MSQFGKSISKLASPSCNGFMAGTFQNIGKSSWDSGRDYRWSASSSSSKDKDSTSTKPMSTFAHAQKLRSEEELRAQTKALQVPLNQIVREVPKQSSWKIIYNEL